MHPCATAACAMSRDTKAEVTPSFWKSLFLQRVTTLYATAQARSVSIVCGPTPICLRTKTAACHCGYPSKSHDHCLVRGSVSSKYANSSTSIAVTKSRSRLSKLTSEGAVDDICSAADIPSGEMGNQPRSGKSQADDCGCYPLQRN